jgi:hypothetical protein
LAKRNLKVEDIQTAFHDGTLLCELLEIISNKQFRTKWTKNPHIKVKKIENLNFALDFCRREGVKLVGIGAEGNESNINNKVTRTTLSSTHKPKICIKYN